MNRTLTLASLTLVGALSATSLMAQATPAPAPTQAPQASASTAPAKSTKVVPAPATSSTTKPTTHKPLVDLNSATVEQLKELPGITDATADAIIKGRPYASRIDLVKHKVITQKEYKQIRYMVSARKPKAA